MLNNFWNKKTLYLHKIAVCCIVKNENHYLKEFIDYHLKIGVEHFYIYDNDSETPITETLKDYVLKELITVKKVQGLAQQMPAYQHCLDNYGKLCKWIAFIDADELIVPKTLSGNLYEFLIPYEKFGALGIHWLMFGSNNLLTKPEDGSQIYNFRRRSLKSHFMNAHIKSIVQPKYIKRLSLDPHHFVLKSSTYCVNENFERLRGPRGTHTSNKIQINHYFLRSLEDFEQKVLRGRADDGTFNKKMDEFYIFDKESNLIADESIIELLMLSANDKIIE